MSVLNRDDLVPDDIQRQEAYREIKERMREEKREREEQKQLDNSE